MKSRVQTLPVEVLIMIFLVFLRQNAKEIGNVMAVCRLWNDVIRNIGEIGKKIAVTLDRQFLQHEDCYYDHLQCSSSEQLDRRIRRSEECDLEVVVGVWLSDLGSWEDEKYTRLFNYLFKCYAKRISSLTLLLNGHKQSTEYRERMDRMLCNIEFQPLSGLVTLSIPYIYNNDMSAFIPLVTMIRASCYESLQDVYIADSIYIQLFPENSGPTSWKQLRRIGVSSSVNNVAFPDWIPDHNCLCWPKITTLEELYVPRLELPFNLGNPDTKRSNHAIKALSLYHINPVMAHLSSYPISHLRIGSFKGVKASQFPPKSLVLSCLRSLDVLEVDDKVVAIHAPLLESMVIKSRKLDPTKSIQLLDTLFKDGASPFSPKQLSLSFRNIIRVLSAITGMEHLRSLHICPLGALTVGKLVSTLLIGDDSTFWKALEELVICKTFEEGELGAIVGRKRKERGYSEPWIRMCGCSRGIVEEEKNCPNLLSESMRMS